MPQDKLLSYIKGLGASLKPNETPGMDCSVVKTRHAGLYLVSTTDFFYPLVEDPYFQGRIAACNVLSDIYAMGVVEIDTVLMILGVSRKMSGPERDAVTSEMIRGFSDTCHEAGTDCTGGQTVLNPWPIIGGVASSCCSESEMIRPKHAEVGDVIVLTKPLGTQIAVNAQQWRREPDNWAKIADLVSEEQVEEAYLKAAESMGRLNRNGALLMHKYGAKAATDVTGFGILGHLTNLAESQTNSVTLEVHTLPVIKFMDSIDKHLGNMFKLEEGFSAETSGGLMVVLPAANAEAFISEYKRIDGNDAWLIGKVTEHDGVPARVVGPTIVSV